MKERLQVLALEPFWGGSHRAAIEGWRNHTRHEVRVEHLPARFWKWRMRGAALEFVRRVSSAAARPDVVFASSMLDVAHFKGALRNPPPVLLYFHENQAAYPGRPGEVEAERDLQFAFTHLASIAAADHVAFNSEFQRGAFLTAMREILRRMPDARPTWILDQVEQGSSVLPLGIETDRFRVRAGNRDGAAPLVLWNHRWEHDKAPEVFFRVLCELAEMGVPFQVAVAGESYQSVPDCFATARKLLGARVVQWGFLEDREAYAALLSLADFVVSTARQENFGLSVLEAAFAGAHPLAPRGLSYPEVLPEALHDRCLYQGETELREMLHRLLTGAAPRLRVEELRPLLKGYDWGLRAADFDRCLAQVSKRTRIW